MTMGSAQRLLILDNTFNPLPKDVDYSAFISNQIGFTSLMEKATVYTFRDWKSGTILYPYWINSTNTDKAGTKAIHKLTPALH